MVYFGLGIWYILVWDEDTRQVARAWCWVVPFLGSVRNRAGGGGLQEFICGRRYMEVRWGIVGVFLSSVSSTLLSHNIFVWYLNELFRRFVYCFLWKFLMVICFWFFISHLLYDWFYPFEPNFFWINSLSIPTHLFLMHKKAVNCFLGFFIGLLVWVEGIRMEVVCMMLKDGNIGFKRNKGVSRGNGRLFSGLFLKSMLSLRFPFLLDNQSRRYVRLYLCIESIESIEGVDVRDWWQSTSIIKILRVTLDYPFEHQHSFKGNIHRFCFSCLVVSVIYGLRRGLVCYDWSWSWINGNKCNIILIVTFKRHIMYNHFWFWYYCCYFHDAVKRDLNLRCRKCHFYHHTRVYCCIHVMNIDEELDEANCTSTDFDLDLIFGGYCLTVLIIELACMNALVFWILGKNLCSAVAVQSFKSADILICSACPLLFYVDFGFWLAGYYTCLHGAAGVSLLLMFSLGHCGINRRFYREIWQRIKDMLDMYNLYFAKIY